MRSMTGFGRASRDVSSGVVRVEVKSTNHKYFDLSVRVPNALQSYEEQIRKVIQSKVRRGKVYASISTPELLIQKNRLYTNTSLAKEYMKAFKKLNKALGLNEKITLNQIIRMPDVLSPSTSSKAEAQAWTAVKSTLLTAILNLDASRRKEGIRLVKDMKSRVAKIKTRTLRIKARSKKIDADITEEVVRLDSHIKTLKQTLSAKGEVGRKVDFIAQEIMRETNTTGAKCNDAIVASHVIEIKSELEKIREQTQNLE